MAKSNHLGEFEQLVLLAVLRLGDDAYGARIQEELESVAGRSSSVPAIYITLTRLEARGMVSSRKGEPRAERGGRARRYFSVEPEGVTLLDEARTSLMSMWDGLDGVVPRSEGASAGG